MYFKDKHTNEQTIRQTDKQTNRMYFIDKHTNKHTIFFDGCVKQADELTQYQEP